MFFFELPRFRHDAAPMPCYSLLMMPLISLLLFADFFCRCRYAAMLSATLPHASLTAMLPLSEGARYHGALFNS